MDYLLKVFHKKYPFLVFHDANIKIISMQQYNFVLKVIHICLFRIIINKMFMQDGIIQRIREMIDKYGLSVTSLAKKIGIVQVTLNRQLTGDSSLSLDTVNSILYHYKEISAEWLLRGEGEMIKGTSPSSEKGKEFVICVDENGFLKLKE